MANTNNKADIALIGAGAMGGAMLRGWIDAGAIAAREVVVFDPAPKNDLLAFCRQKGVALNTRIEDARPRLVVVAVKPQAAGEALADYRLMAAEATVLSIMAGARCEGVAAASGSSRVARAMPNLPASIGAGATGLYAPPNVSADDRALIDKLMGAVGETVWVDTEDALDLVTAVSGSGPAYFFLLAEALAEAGADLGLPKEAAAKLASATLVGAGALLAADPRGPADLRKSVTSPGGTTAAALSVLDGKDAALRKLAAKAVKAAARRSAELKG